MGHEKPPKRLPQQPVIECLSAGSLFFRLHRTQYRSDSFNPKLSDRYFGGGRFDSTADDKYGYMYLGSTAGVAISETLLRDVPFDGKATRRLSRGEYKDYRLSAVQLTQDINVLSITSGQHLAAVGQDSWLTQAPGLQYAHTRHWCHWLRSHVSAASGLVWMSKREPSERALVLFSDRLPLDCVTQVNHFDAPEGSSADFGTPEGRKRLRSLLAPFGATITL